MSGAALATAMAPSGLPRRLRDGCACTDSRHGNILPVGLLHPRLAEKVRPMFLRGDYDVAVFQALNKQTLKELRVFVPDLPTQRRMLEIQAKIADEQNTVLEL